MRLDEGNPGGNVPAIGDRAQISTRLDGSSKGPCILDPCRCPNDSVLVGYSFRTALSTPLDWAERARYCGQLTEQRYFPFHRYAYHLPAIVLLRYIFGMNVKVVGDTRHPQKFFQKICGSITLAIILLTMLWAF